MSKQKKIRKVLLTARAEDSAVRIQRGWKRAETIEGFVVGVGRKWTLIATTTTGGFFDGYATIRLTDITRARPYDSWEHRFFQTLPEWPPRPPAGRSAIDLDTTSGMLATFLEPGVLLSIERRKKHAMWVGVPNELTRNWFYLWEVDANAVWDPAPRGYRPRTVTLVRTGHLYLQGLAVVADSPPSEDLPHHWTARSKASRRENRTATH
ncbi:MULTISPECIES: hypothetical protein [unclassified Rathayibacter]|uniref:hypothetical protein n=1 Tax=unclassified Rathayibacter TaxID=2609250 RepID=UPI000F4B878E|nr:MULTISPECIES: hypothetical protein [unclassified Rathayibacter]ROP50159.1 hypothetical protein EDF45_1568 [Rathayibacter sp. PhB186]ROS53117.1 hypothetical protein EDF44_1568 [Rathayibacter sp. PhB185]TCL83630.1 hypothetical protein EDF49_10359 [Rathayibacter sp. PhB192]TCM29223.1 hypothetical protein EDF43_10359 [Rathayibacter sp. PhB179]